MLSQCLNSIVAIYITIPLLLIPQILLCGLVVSFTDLTPRSTTGNVPLIGNVIPSRWAYEALAVTSYTDNAYDESLFALNRQKQENQYYNQGFLYELQSQLETLRDEQLRGKPVDPRHMDVIGKNLPQLTAYCAMQPYRGDSSYTSLHDYFLQAEDILTKAGNRATLEANAVTTLRVLEMGREGLLQLKREHHNLTLEDYVTGADQRQMVEVIDGYIVPRMGLIFLTPQSTCGQAPFYSCEKVIGSWHIKTLWYNIAMLLFMSMVASILLYTDCPGRYLRKETA